MALREEKRLQVFKSPPPNNTEQNQCIDLGLEVCYAEFREGMEPDAWFAYLHCDPCAGGCCPQLARTGVGGHLSVWGRVWELLGMHTDLTLGAKTFWSSALLQCRVFFSSSWENKTTKAAMQQVQLLPITFSASGSVDFHFGDLLEVGPQFCSVHLLWNTESLLVCSPPPPHAMATFRSEGSKPLLWTSVKYSVHLYLVIV